MVWLDNLDMHPLHMENSAFGTWGFELGVWTNTKNFSFFYI